METKDLPNYGLGFSGLMSDTLYIKQMDRQMRREFSKDLGFWTMLRWMLPMRSETKRVQDLDWSGLTRRGIPRKFIDNVSSLIATYKSLVDLIGKERASGAFFRVWDRTAYDPSDTHFPSAMQLKSCGDAFLAYKDWMKAFEAADEKKGLFETVTLEDDNNAYVWEETYCGFNEIARKCGSPYLAYPSLCYWEEAYMPALGANAGWKFSRDLALSKGDKVCRNRLERIIPRARSSIRPL